MSDAFRDVYSTEAHLSRELYRAGARHAADPDVYQLSQTLASRCRDRLDALGPHAARYEAKPPPEMASPSGPAQAIRRASSELLSRSATAAPLLLNDLNILYILAHQSEIAWVVLHQAARAKRDVHLIEVTSAGQQEAQMRWQWLRTRIKETAPQVLAAR